MKNLYTRTLFWRSIFTLVVIYHELLEVRKDRVIFGKPLTSVGREDGEWREGGEVGGVGPKEEKGRRLEQ